MTSGNLIAASKVEGTNVYNLAGESLRSFDDIMIDKAAGRTIYFVVHRGIPDRSAGCLPPDWTGEHNCTGTQEKMQ